MKNKLYIKSILILIVGVLLLTGSLINHKNKQLDKNDLENIEFAIYLENVKTTTFPSKDSGYYYDPTLTSCSDGSSIEWNYELWYPIIKNVNKT